MVAEAAIEVQKKITDSLAAELKNQWKEQKERMAAEKAKER